MYEIGALSQVDRDLLYYLQTKFPTLVRPKKLRAMVGDR